ncbi:MAG TPA: hypothetical protein VMV91_14825 [Rhodocyclaceae bacterium]|nr:hypothetical protein [Rhodocyclaceae bacterium]
MNNTTPANRNVRASNVSPVLLLSLAMPRTAAALLENGGTIANLAQALPATAAALLALTGGR